MKINFRQDGYEVVIPLGAAAGAGVRTCWAVSNSHRTISRKGVCIGSSRVGSGKTFRLRNVYPTLRHACIFSRGAGFPHELFANERDRAMTSDVGTDGGVDSLIDGIGRLSQISNRTSLMTIDAVLRALPRDGQGYAAAAAAELRTVARRVVHSTRDCGASLPEAR